ncbi:MAG: hypothetical protein ABI888_04975 [Chloroflexota bacterium]
MWKCIALTATLAMSCTSTSADALPSGTTSPVSVATNATAFPTANALPGTTFSMPTTDDMITFAADRGALIAFSTLTASPSVFHSKVQRADAPSGPWKTVYETDALWLGGSVGGGRAAIVEYRELRQVGVGAYSADITVIDLDNGKATAIDHFSMSPATFRGGGSAPRRPNSALVIGADAVAWTRLIEGPPGTVTGELRVASLTDLSRPIVIGSSADWVSPLGFAGRRLVYVTATKTEEQLHLRDLDTTTDRIVATGPVGRTEIGEVPAWDQAQITGHWAVSVDRSGRTPNEPMRILDLDTGAERTFPKDVDCGFPQSVGRRYIVWCSAILDAGTLAPVSLALKSTDRGVIASDDGLIWFDVSFTPRRGVLYRPRP